MLKFGVIPTLSVVILLFLTLCGFSVIFLNNTPLSQSVDTEDSPKYSVMTQPFERILPGLCVLVLFSLEWKVSFSQDAYKYISDLNFCCFTGFASKVTRKFWTSSVSISTTVSIFCSVDFHSCRFVVMVVTIILVTNTGCLSAWGWGCRMQLPFQS